MANSCQWGIMMVPCWKKFAIRYQYENHTVSEHISLIIANNIPWKLQTHRIWICNTTSISRIVPIKFCVRCLIPSDWARLCWVGDRISTISKETKKLISKAEGDVLSFIFSRLMKLSTLSVIPIELLLIMVGTRYCVKLEKSKPLLIYIYIFPLGRRSIFVKKISFL